MTLEPGVIALVLLAAAPHATWNAFVKAGGAWTGRIRGFQTR